VTKEDVKVDNPWKSKKIAESSYEVIRRLFFCRFPLGKSCHSRKKAEIQKTKIFKLNFFDFWLTDFSKIFREHRGIYYLSMCKFKKKSIGDKILYQKFGWGAIAPQGVLKSQKVLRWIDRESRDLYNAVKILALSSAQLQIKQFQFYFLKFLNLIFWKSGRQNFFKFSANVEGMTLYRSK